MKMIMKRSQTLLGSLALAAAFFSSPAIGLGQESAPVPPALAPEEEWAGDPAVHMIAIEALVVEINEDKTQSLGVHAGLARKDGAGNVIEGADFIFGPSFSAAPLPIFRGDGSGTQTGFAPRLPGIGVNFQGVDIDGAVFSARLRALLDTGDARITTRPVILSMNGAKAVIDVGSKVPYQDFTVAGAPQVAEQTIGVTMEVTPNILDLLAGTLELDITKVQVTSLSQILSSENIDRPVFSTSDTRTRVKMRSGETYRLSSFKKRTKAKIREGVPVLMHIPLLGRLFSGEQEVERGVDVLFFITPHIIPPGQNAVVPYDFKRASDIVHQSLGGE